LFVDAVDKRDVTAASVPKECHLNRHTLHHNLLIKVIQSDRGTSMGGLYAKLDMKLVHLINAACYVANRIVPVLIELTFGRSAVAAVPVCSRLAK
jgi:hypothetical protein